ncbi:MAG: hypothetical protein H8M99_09955 [Gloeobacteraceae cyanobacterium ES-bin-144]|nr:hypothetical protein [Verrucomicrobiales bacterium]
MKTTHALVAAALAGVFAAGATHASASPLSPVTEKKEKDKCPAKDEPAKLTAVGDIEKDQRTKEKCPPPEKDKNKGTIL